MAEDQTVEIVTNYDKFNEHSGVPDVPGASLSLQTAMLMWRRPVYEHVSLEPTKEIGKHVKPLLPSEILTPQF